MTALILALCGILFALCGASVFLWQARAIALGRISLEVYENGPEQVHHAFVILMRIFLKRTVVWRKLLFQYVLHVWVRILFYVDKIFGVLYIRSRNFFVRSAVKNKSSVPHFWEHLKVYKQEIDKEKEES